MNYLRLLATVPEYRDPEAIRASSKTPGQYYWLWFFDDDYTEAWAIYKLAQKLEELQHWTGREVRGHAATWLPSRGLPCVGEVDEDSRGQALLEDDQQPTTDRNEDDNDLN